MHIAVRKLEKEGSLREPFFSSLGAEGGYVLGRGGAGSLVIYWTAQSEKPLYPAARDLAVRELYCHSHIACTDKYHSQSCALQLTN